MTLDINPYRTVVKEFEDAVAAYAGAPHAIAVDTCTSAIFLSLQWKLWRYDYEQDPVIIPSRTYCSVANAIVHCRLMMKMHHEQWEGEYELRPWKIIDSALRFRRNMYKPGEMRCLSFQYRKHLPIGRGGMILTDNRHAADWLRLARFNGRPEKPLDDKSAEPLFPGWLMHMEPERAARGLNFMMHVKNFYPDLQVEYPQLHLMKAYRSYLVD